MTYHLILGGCGFLGRHVARGLALRGERVVVADRIPFPTSAMRIESIICDLAHASPEDMDRLVGGAAVVHHYAWSTIPNTANQAPLQDLTDNVGLTLKLLEALRRRGDGRIVFTSSGGTVYGRLMRVPAPEDHPLDPITAYGVSKLAAEKYLSFYAQMHGIDARVARISNPYGAGQSALRPQGAVTTFVHRAIAGQAIEIWGDGKVLRDFIHIKDLVDMMLALTDFSPIAGGSSVVINIGSGIGSSLNDIVEAIEQEFGRGLIVNRQPARPFDVPISVLDISRATKLLQRAPQVSLQLGIRKMIADLKEDHHRLFSS